MFYYSKKYRHNYTELDKPRYANINEYNPLFSQENHPLKIVSFNIKFAKKRLITNNIRLIQTRNKRRYT